MTQAVILTMVADREQGLKIARSLVEAGLAACVNVIGGATSVYRWQGKICEERELLLVIKTEAANFTEIKERILSLHDYELPEIVMFHIDKGYDEYLKWISANG